MVTWIPTLLKNAFTKYGFSLTSILDSELDCEKFIFVYDCEKFISHLLLMTNLTVKD